MLEIQQTGQTPHLHFRPSGYLRMKGRIVCIDARQFFEKPIDFCKKLNVTKVAMDVHLDYINTVSSKYFVVMLNALEDNLQVEEVQVNWFYESDDLDMLDTGKDYLGFFEKVKFKFHSIPNQN